MSPDPGDVNLRWVRGREAGANNSFYNLTVEVKGEIVDLANTSYLVRLFADPTNQTHWTVNYTDGLLLLSSNQTSPPVLNITGNATVWGANPAKPNALSMAVNKTLLGPVSLSADVNLDATAIMRGNPALNQSTYQDFGWEVPGHPATSPTILRGHVYVLGTTTPIQGATVALSGGPSAQTNASGGYEIAVTPGTYTVTVSAPGYVASTFSVTLTLGQTVTQDVGLEPTPGTGGVGIAGIPWWILLLVVLLIVVVIVIIVWKRRNP